MPDPIWLPDVLRRAGLEVREYPGWRDRGHGDFGAITHVICHHTGSFGETPRGIAEHPQLGLCSQLHLDRNGVYTMCGAGIAWHAGVGAYPGLPTNNANQVTIGIEAANDGGGKPGLPHRASWSDAQYNAYVRGVAAILAHLGLPATRAIGHKEWAGPAQGKWDPGAIDMNTFRRDVQAVLDGNTLTSEGDDNVSWLTQTFNNFKGTALSYKDLFWWMDKNTAESLEQFMGPEQDGKRQGWKVLGRSKVADRDNTVVEALAEVRTDVAEIKALLQERKA